jgi:hypothetical protein
MNTIEFKSLIHWIKNRLVHKYQETDQVILDTLDSLINNNYCLSCSKIDDEKINSLCKKYYVDFDYEKEDSDILNIGYTKEEKLKLKQFITNLCKDLMEIQTL